MRQGLDRHRLLGVLVPYVLGTPDQIIERLLGTVGSNDCEGHKLEVREWDSQFG